MKSIMKILWFIIKLPFRILALVIVAPLSILGIMINIISNMGGVVIGLFNIFMLIGVFGILHSQDWVALRSVKEKSTMNYEEFKNEFVDALQERLYEGGNEVSIHSYYE